MTPFKTLALALALAAALARPAAALNAPDTIQLMIGSHHTDARYRFNNRTYGIFVGWHIGAKSILSVGAYRNSYRRGSLAVAFAHYLTHGAFKIGYTVGLSNYPVEGRHQAVHIGTLVPMIGLQAQYRCIILQFYPGAMPGERHPATRLIVAFGLTGMF